MKVNLVFEGGGILGVAFIGAYQSIVNHGYKIERCGGASAGSIIASLIIAGYEPSELLAIMKSTNFAKLMHKTKLCRIPLIGKTLSLVYKKGLYDYHAIEDWVDGLLTKKGIKTFNDLIINDQSRLKIIASDITNRNLLILPDDAHLIGINPRELSVARAVAMSCAIPLVFTPIVIDEEQKRTYIVDGGLMSSFPIWVFDVEESAKIPTLGIKINDKVSNASSGKTGLIAYIEDLLNATYLREETTFLSKQQIVDIITIDFDNSISALDFDIGKRGLEYLYQSGRESTDQFLENHGKLKSLQRINLISKPN